MMKSMLKRALGVVAAAAMAVTGMTALAGTANAAANDIRLGDTIVFTASSPDQFNGRDLEYIKVAGLTAHNTTATESKQGLSYLEVVTEMDPVRTAVVNALKGKTFAGATDTQFKDGVDGDPMAWVANNLTEDALTPVKYDGNLRTFASALQDQLATSQAWTQIDWDNSDGSSNATLMGSTLTVNNLNPGIYLIRDSAGVSSSEDGSTSTEKSIVMLVSTKVDVNEDSATVAPGLEDMGGVVELKNHVTTVDKTVDGSAVSVGGEKTYTIYADVPNWTDRTAPFTFEFTDTPTKGQTVLFNTIELAIVQRGESGASDTVKAPNFYQPAMLTKPTSMTDNNADKWDATYDSTADGAKKDPSNSFTVNLTDWMKDNYKTYCDQGYKVKLTYDVRINSEAALDDATPVQNDVTVNNNGSTATDSTTINKPVDIVFTKVQGDNASPLAGAKFKVQMKQDDDSFVDMHRDETTGAWSVADVDKPATEFESVQQNGEVTIPGLGEGVYKIVETQAPDDYWQILPAFQVTIDANGVIMWDANSGDVEWDLVSAVKDVNQNVVSVKVKNVNKLTQLPLTGAAGITMFIVLGLLIAGAGVTVYMKSRSVRKAMRA